MSSPEGQPGLKTARPFFSVMIPTYAPRPDYLEATLRSVLDQDPGPEVMQIEVVDDCSPRACPEALIKRLGGDRIGFRRTAQNLGLAGAWNECISRARGEWVHILHQDDLVLPGFYEHMRRGVEVKPEVSAAFCRHAYIDDAGRWVLVSELEAQEPKVLLDFALQLARAQLVQCPAIVVRKASYAKAGTFKGELAYVLDWDMWLRVSLTGDVWYEPKILACYRLHGASTTSGLQRSATDVRDIGRFLETARSYFPGRRGDGALAQARRYYARRAVGTADRFLKAGDWAAAWNQLNAAWRLAPSIGLIPGTLKCGLRSALLPALARRSRPGTVTH